MNTKNNIVFMTQPSVVQQGQNGANIPSLIGQPLIPIDISKNFVSYTQMNNDIVNEIKQKGVIKDDIATLYAGWKEKCDLHMKKPSDKCRRCKIIINNIKTQHSDLNKANSPPVTSKQTKTPNLPQKIVTISHDVEYDDLQHVSVSGNLNSLLLNNILSCQYFKEIVIFKNFPELIEEIKNNVTNIEAWAVGISGVPSTFFCCFYRLVLLTINTQQIKQLLNSSNIYVKISGLLYLRFVAQPKSLWGYLSPFLNDETIFFPGVDKKSSLSIAEYVGMLLKEYNHFGTRLPRIPIQIERDIRIKLICFEEAKRRKNENFKNIDKIFTGKKVKIFSYDTDNENPRCKFGKVINVSNRSAPNKDEIRIEINVEGKVSQYDLAQFDIVSDESEIEEGEDKTDIEDRRKRESKHSKHKHRHSKHHHHRTRSRSRSHSHSNSLLRKVIEDEKRTAIAHGKEYAIKPTSFKKSISVKVPGMYKKKSNTSHTSSPIPHDVKVEIPSRVKNEENPKQKYTDEFIKRKEKLMQQYDIKLKNELNNKDKDYIGPEIMKLG